MDAETSHKYIYNTTVELLTVKPDSIDYFSSSKEISRKKRKFYKKRIVQLFKELLLAKPKDTQHIHVPESIKELINTLVFECIEYFEMTDITDIINKDKSNAVFEDDDPLFGRCSDNTDENDLEEEEELIYNTSNNNSNTDIVSTLDDFVIRKPINISSNSDSTTKLQSDNEKDYDYARIKPINLYDLTLKTKGITKIKKVIKI